MAEERITLEQALMQISANLGAQSNALAATIAHLHLAGVIDGKVIARTIRTQCAAPDFPNTQYLMDALSGRIDRLIDQGIAENGGLTIVD